MTYFAYIHARPNTVDASGIFYVGKGRKQRITPSVAQQRSKHHQNIVNKYGVDNILVGAIECSTESAAFDLECGLIKCLRRMGVSLVNQTDGGEGISGFKQPPHCSGENHPMKRPEVKSKISGDNSPTKRQDVKLKLSIAAKGKVVSAEARKNMSLAHTKRYEDLSARLKVGLVSKGKKRVNNGVTEKSVCPSEVADYLEQGWQLGRKPFTRSAPSLETRLKISAGNKGKVAHNKGVPSKSKGQHRPVSVGMKISETRKGGRWITDGVTCLYTHNTELPSGWRYGRSIKKCV